MSEEKEMIGTESANTTTNTQANKPKRRGISNDTKATTRKKFHDSDAVKNIGLFLGNIANVSSGFVTITGNGLPSFTGHAIPKFHLDFVSLHENASEKKYAPFDIFPVESNVDTIPGGSKEWAFNQVMNSVKHILDVLVFRGRAMTPEEEEMLELSYCDYTIDEFGNYSYEPVDIEDIIKGWQVLFDNVVKLIETGNNGRSATLNTSGKPVKVWGKLIRYYKNKGEWTSAASKSQEGDLVFPSFVGAGLFELVSENKDTKQMNRPSLMLDVTKECIAPMNITKKQPSLNAAPNMGGIGIGSGLVPPMPGGMGGQDQFAGSFAAGDAGGDMPF